MCPQKLVLGKHRHLTSNENVISERAQCSKIKVNPTPPWQNPSSVWAQFPGQVGIWQVLHHWCGETDALGEKPADIPWNALITNVKCLSEELFPSKRWQHTGENEESWNICWLLITWRHMHNQYSERCTSGQNQRLTQERRESHLYSGQDGFISTAMWLLHPQDASERDAY